MFRTVVVTVSDRCFAGQMKDESGPLVEETLPPAEYTVLERKIVPDEVDVVKGALMHYATRGDVDLIFTSGGTGFSPRDVTPEATAMVVQKRTPGIDYALVSNGMNDTPHAILSRGISGIRHTTLIINLPGSPGSIEGGINTLLPVLPHALKLLQDEALDEEHKHAGDK